MKIEAGKYYRTRGGQVFGPMVPGGYPASDYVWCLDPLLQGYNWDSEGSWCKGWDGPLDLISEVYVRDTPPGVYASEAEQERDVFFNRLGRITEELNLPMDATASRIIEAIRALSDTPPGMVLVPREPTDAMIKACLQAALDFMAETKTIEIHPAQTYPSPSENARRCWRAMVQAVEKEDREP